MRPSIDDRAVERVEQPGGDAHQRASCRRRWRRRGPRGAPTVRRNETPSNSRSPPGWAYERSLMAIAPMGAERSPRAGGRGGVLTCACRRWEGRLGAAAVNSVPEPRRRVSHMRYQFDAPVRRLRLAGRAVRRCSRRGPAGSRAGRRQHLDAARSVMTRNLYLGADLNPALAAIGSARRSRSPAGDQPGHLEPGQSPPNFPARAKVLAKEIDNDDPVHRRPAGGCALAQRPGQRRQGRDDRRTYDFLATLLSELAARGNQVQGGGRPARRPTSRAPRSPPRSATRRITA